MQPTLTAAKEVRTQITEVQPCAGLTERRRLAAELSRGTSSEAIYRAVEEATLTFQGDLLDFGAGSGNLTNRFARSGRFSSITAVDLTPRPADVDRSVRWVMSDLNDPTPLAEHTFDVIVAAEVIEHLENPRATSRELSRLLRSRGVLILSTPNNESWRSILSFVIQGHFAAFRDQSYPAHISALLRKDLERVLAEAGFSRPIFAFTNSGVLPKMTSVSWQRVSRGRLKGLRYSDNLIAIARKPGESE